MRDQPASGNIQDPARDAFTVTPTRPAAESYFSTLFHLITALGWKAVIRP
jgi:hypothetical protein